MLGCNVEIFLPITKREAQGNGRLSIFTARSLDTLYIPIILERSGETLLCHRGFATMSMQAKRRC